ncbi:MAG: hypothetical protein QOF94_1259 [Acidobacteriaceae bacterium]
MNSDVISRRELLHKGAAILAVAATGCGRDVGGPPPVQAPVDSHRIIIEAALVRMLERADGSVIFEERMSRKFVQFACSADRTLWMDLPSQTLDQTEMERATAFFLEQDVRAVEYDLLDRPGGNVAGRQRSFQKDFGRDFHAAAEVVSGVFGRVYQFPPGFELLVTEN